MSRCSTGRRGLFLVGLLPLSILACSDVPTTVERQPSAILIEPSNFELESGSTQALRIIVLDANGRQMSRIPASASIVWESVDPMVATVDDQGVVRARLPGETDITARITYTADANGGFSGAASMASPPNGRARGHAMVRGGEPEMVPLVETELSGVAGELSSPRPTVKLVDRRGKAIRNIPIRFSSSAGSAQDPVVYTDNDGIAGTDWRLGGEPGTQLMDADVPELLEEGVEFAANVTGGAAEVAANGGGAQTGTVGDDLSESLSVLVTDQDAAPLAGINVNWAVEEGGGSISPSSSTTGSDGRASASWTLGDEAGTQSASATVGALPPVEFSAIAEAGPPAQITKSGGDGQTAAVETELPLPLSVSVSDEYGNPVGGIAVQWQTMTGGAGNLAPQSQQTDGQGNASAVWTLGATAGQHYAQASVQGGSEVLFGATSTSGGDDGGGDDGGGEEGCSIESIVISPEGPLTMNALGATIQLAASAFDADGSPVSDVSYTWSSSNESIAGVNTGGKVTANLAGTAMVIVAVAGCAASDEVQITVAPLVAMIAVSPGSVSLQPGQSVHMTAEPRDSNGNPLPAPVTWTSADPAIASVDGSGNVSANTPGSTEVSAHADGTTESAVVTVADVPPPNPSADAELPRVYINTTYIPQSDTIRVQQGGSLQSAINAASRGTLILLPPGFVSGPITLPNKSGSGWIYIQTDTQLPPEGTRLTPGLPLAKILTSTNNISAVHALSGGGYRLVGVEIAPTTAVDVLSYLVRLEPGTSGFVWDRVYVHGVSGRSLRRCFGGNAANVAWVDSYISDCHGSGMETQGIAIWDSPGPVKIVNNFISASAINILFGGANGVTPCDIEIKRNHLFKPLSWQGVWSVKNILESKNSCRALVEGNVLENTWPDAQQYALNLKSANDGGNCNHCITADWTFRNNVIKGSQGSGITITGGEAYSGGTYQYARRIVIENVLIDGGVDNIVFQVANGVGSVTIDHVTVRNVSPARLCSVSLTPARGQLVMTNNRFPETSYGCKGDSQVDGTNTFNAYFGPNGYTVTGNLFDGVIANNYPSGNYFNDGSAPASTGVNWTLLNSKIAGVVIPGSY